jgi:uncharacterized tellurite resistance protein B-like protein
MAFSLQDQLAQKIKDLYPNAEVKKINKDNFLDIHVPSVHPKRGTHLFFNTSKDLIKIGFYCREEDFIAEILKRVKSLESYSQGIRPLGNPEFTSVEEAVSCANSMVNNMANLEPKAPKEDIKVSEPKNDNPPKKESDKSLPTQKEEAKAKQNSQTKSIPDKPNKKESKEYCFDDPESFLTSIQLLRNYYLALSSSSYRFRSEFEKLLLDFTSLSVVPKIGDDILRIMHEDGFGIGALLFKPMHDAEKIYEEEFETHDEYVTYSENYVSDINAVADQTLLLDTISFLIKLGNILDENESPSGNLSAQDRYFPVFLILKTNPNLELNTLKSVLKEIDYEGVDTLLLKASGNFNQLSNEEKLGLILYDFILWDEPDAGLDIKSADITAARSIFSLLTKNASLGEKLVGGFNDNASFEIFQFFNVEFNRAGFHEFCLERWKELSAEWNIEILQVMMTKVMLSFHPNTYKNNPVLEHYLEIYYPVLDLSDIPSSDVLDSSVEESKEKEEKGTQAASAPKKEKAVPIDKGKKKKEPEKGPYILDETEKTLVITSMLHSILFVILQVGSKLDRFTEAEIADIQSTAVTMGEWFDMDEDECLKALHETLELLKKCKAIFNNDGMDAYVFLNCVGIYNNVSNEAVREDIIRYMNDLANADGKVTSKEKENLHYYGMLIRHGDDYFNDPLKYLIEEAENKNPAPETKDKSQKTKKVKIGEHIVIDASTNTLICNLFHKILFVIITTGSNFKPEGEYDEGDPEILRYTDDAVNDVSQSALAMGSWFNYDEDDCADFLNETYEMIGELKKQSFILSDITASFCYIIHENIDTEEGRNDIVRFMMDHAQVDGEVDELEDIYLDLNKSKILFGRLF